MPGVTLVERTAAFDKFCVNGIDLINKLIIDGKRYAIHKVKDDPKLKNRKDWHKCDCIRIPPNTGHVAIEATYNGGPRGIQVNYSATR